MQFEFLHVDFVAFALFAGEPTVGFAVADDFFFVGVPANRALQADGDVGEVAGSHRAMVREHIGDRLRAVAHAFDEVAHVVAGLLAFAELAEVVFEDWLFGEVGDGGAADVVQVAAADEDFAALAFDPNAVARAIADDEDGAVGISAGDIEFRGGVVLIVDRRTAVFEGDGQVGDGFDAQGAGVVHAHRPLRDVDVVRAPVGELAAGVFVPPAEFVMRAAGGVARVRGARAALNVIDQRRLALPHFPIQDVGDRHFRQRRARLHVADRAGDLADFAELAGVGQGDGLEELVTELGVFSRRSSFLLSSFFAPGGGRRMVSNSSRCWVPTWNTRPVCFCTWQIFLPSSIVSVSGFSQ